MEIKGDEQSISQPQMFKPTEGQFTPATGVYAVKI